MLLARSSATAAEDFVSTRRGGVGAAARTRLAEAHRHYRLAIEAAQADPEGALSQAQRADTLARQARALAEQDVGQFHDSKRGRNAGPRRIRRTSAPRFWAGSSSMACRRWRIRRGADSRPGSFGGTGNRGRHSVGGRS